MAWKCYTTEPIISLLRCIVHVKVIHEESRHKDKKIIISHYAQLRSFGPSLCCSRSQITLIVKLHI